MPVLNPKSAKVQGTTRIVRDDDIGKTASEVKVFREIHSFTISTGPPSAHNKGTVRTKSTPQNKQRVRENPVPKLKAVGPQFHEDHEILNSSRASHNPNNQRNIVSHGNHSVGDNEQSVKTDNTCDCDSAIQEYCQRQDHPFCTCKDDPSQTTNQAPPSSLVNKTLKTRSSQAPIGSKFYPDGERSRNKKRDVSFANIRNSSEAAEMPSPNLSEIPSSEFPVVGHPGHAPIASPPTRRSRGLVPNVSVDPALGFLNIVNRATAGEDHSSPASTRFPSPTDHPNTRSSYKDPLTCQSKRESIKNLKILRSKESSWCSIKGCLMAILFIWLLLITIYIFNPGDINVCQRCMTKMGDMSRGVWDGVYP